MYVPLSTSQLLSIRTRLDADLTTGQPPRFAYPEHPIPQPAKKNTSGRSIIPPANYGHVRGGPTAGLMGGTGGRETLGDLGLVPQSVLMVKWQDEDMNGQSHAHTHILVGRSVWG